MTRDEALRLALEALSTSMYPQPRQLNAIAAIKAALEAKDEKANDELRRLHDLLGKANALARIRANKIDELEQRLTKTEAQLGEAVWNYGELKREQLANQQKTSGSPINTSTALEAKDEPLQSVWNTLPSNKDVEDAMRMKRLQQLSTPPRRTPITDEDIRQANHHMVCGAYDYSFKQGVRWAEKVHGIKWEWEK